MNPVSEIETTRPRSLAALCRRRDQLKAEGVRADTLSWAVAEASDLALALLGLPGPEMVRSCLGQARDPRHSGSEAEALMVFAAAGVGRVRRELRALGVTVSLNRYEARGEIRRTPRPEPRAALEAIRQAGARVVMEAMCDGAVPFNAALAERIEAASEVGEGSRVRALCEVAAFGARELRRGIRVDVGGELAGADLADLAELMEAERPRVLLRSRARGADGEEAERYALLSFIQTGWLGRSVREARAQRDTPIARALHDAEARLAGGQEVEAVRVAGESHVVAQQQVPVHAG